MKSYICNFCYKTFDSKHTDRNVKFCSKECYQNSIRTIKPIQCKFCHKTIVHPKKNRTVFCSKECQLNAWREPRKRICRQCSKTFYVKDEGKTGFFCSNKCMGISYRSERIKYNCQTCGKTIEKPVAHAGKFCSRKCAGIHIRKEPIIYICQQCGKQYRKIGSKGRGEKYCSQTCFGKAHIAKPDPFYYKDYRGPAWNKTARSIRERDNYECKICGKVGTDRTIDVHHIISFRLFGPDYISANDPKNLISLCRSCHAKVTHGSLQLNFTCVTHSYIC